MGCASSMEPRWCTWSRRSRSRVSRCTAVVRRRRVDGSPAHSAASNLRRRSYGTRASPVIWCSASATRGHVPVSSERAISLDAPHQVVTADVASAERTHTLRHDDCFGLFNEIGDIDAEARTEAGLYRAGVRHLSRLTLTVAGLRPLLLAATPRED